MLSMIDLHDTLLYDNVNPERNIGGHQMHAAKSGKARRSVIALCQVLFVNSSIPIHDWTYAEVQPGIEKYESSLQDHKYYVD